jgi:predicted transcriptional regulator
VTDYRATPEQWAQCEEWLENPVIGASDACILELRARVEALEAAAHKHIVETSANILALASRVEALEANSKPTPNPSQIRSSLVERVADAIAKADDDGLTNMTWSYHARAAIREVAAWLDENTGGDAAWMLTQEAGR